jgi:TonB family protein
VKQTFCAALLSFALPVLAMAQDGPAIQLKDSIVCRGNRNDVVGCVTPPRQTHAPKAKYPENERKARHQGVVTLGVVVGSDGVPRDISVLSSLSPDFDKAAIDALRQWKFSPATKDGKPVAVRIAVDVDFDLTR